MDRMVNQRCIAKAGVKAPSIFKFGANPIPLKYGEEASVFRIWRSPLRIGI